MLKCFRFIGKVNQFYSLCPGVAKIHGKGRESSVGYNFLFTSLPAGDGCLCSRRRLRSLLFFVIQLAKHLCLIKSEHRQFVLPFEYVIFLL